MILILRFGVQTTPAFIITPKDGIVRWIGNPEEMAAPLESALKAA